jgi:hypothetical protein
MKTTTVGNITLAAKQALESHGVSFGPSYNDVYRFYSHVSGAPTIQVNEQFEIEGTRFCVKHEILYLQSEVDEEEERLRKIQHVVVALSSEKLEELVAAVASITGLPQKLITDGEYNYIVDYSKYAESGDYRKMKVLASYDPSGKRLKV